MKTELIVGEEYSITHSIQGCFRCRIIVDAKQAVYAKITVIKKQRFMSRVRVGDEVRITRGLCTFNLI